MSYLTEVEIFDRMKASLRTAIEACEQLAIEPYKGPMYLHFREHMKLVDGCCRQASAWREDTRWLNIANLIFKSRTMAGNWLRGEEVVRKPDGGSAVMFARLNAPHAYKCFTTLAQNLKQIELMADKTKNEATGVRGAILPTPLADPNRERTHFASRTPGGVLLN